jgi:hypothetical protein
MSWYGIDAVDKAISRTRRALFEPFDFWKWMKLAIVIFFLSGAISNFGNSGTNYRTNPEDFTNTSLGSDLIQDSTSYNIIENIHSSITSFSDYGLLIGLIAGIILLVLLFAYVSSVMEFVFVESLVKNDVKFWAYSRRFLGKGFNLLLVRLALGIIFLVLLGIAAIPLISSIIKNSSNFSWFILLGWIFWILGVVALLNVFGSIIYSFLSLAIPISIYRDLGILSAFRLVFANFRKNWQQVLVYWGVRLVLGLLLSIFFLILVLMLLFVLLIIFLIIDGILYFVFSAVTSEPLNWILLIPFVLIELLLLLGTLLFLNVPLTVFQKYHQLSFLEAWFADASIPFFDSPAAGIETGLSESEPGF